ncbi:DUF2613 domain-containing protein [Mycobacterium asiaticum]|uniref:DUF2613 domain-containing protein n=1 Tax=Mycobacterium asiaticum TaxID=1790 RepID=A0A1A3MW76_MYCAS|nr:DUF2613 domain-containing protein [Mycobacterium asiaticum]OBK12412.1 hypothetical protein A5636_12085 [Mycobacterium asiaticum]
MPGFSLAAAFSVVAGLSLGAAATVGVTLMAQESESSPSVRKAPAPVVSTVVQYGDRCLGC